MSQAQTIYAANFFKDKMCELVNDMKDFVVQNGPESFNVILEGTHDKLRNKKIYTVNFGEADLIEKVFVENTHIRTQNGQLKEIQESFAYISINKII